MNLPYESLRNPLENQLVHPNGSSKCKEMNAARLILRTAAKWSLLLSILAPSIFSPIRIIEGFPDVQIIWFTEWTSMKVRCFNLHPENQR
jgi:hypothetical protein